MDPLLETSLRPTVTPKDGSHRLVIAHMYPQSGGETLLDLPATLGRDHTCDVVLEDSSVSRHHARIEHGSEGELLLRDLSSRNGSFLNRRRIDEAPLRPGDLLRFGDVLVRLLIQPEDMHTVDNPEDLLIGGSGLDGVRRHIRLLGPTNLRILITGESGTGKELVAQELHRRGGGPFIAVNCAALPESLVEAELFGYAQGAFTGATRHKPGLFEAARGGTLFLDEVTELPLPSQAKLLRVVESGEVRRVGEINSTKTSCRILSATNHDVKRDIERGRFRGDLAARLAEAEIHLPPLRERLEDLPSLMEHLTQRAGCKLNLSSEALEAMACYHWPLNVRELDNVVRMLDVLTQGEEVELSMLPNHLLAADLRQMTAPRDRSSKISRVVEALRKNQGNIRRTSEVLGVSRSYIYRCLDRSGLDPVDLRNGTRNA
ncbi:MAG: sigma 54-interacting transcriptional regulator [Deltaproteobacteria bacterium]|nr:sigma 54-interacting transcriptional regulator [Deltaproteobacteria bacterium]